MGRITSVAIFADCGATAHQALYRQAGETIARHGAHLHCAARNGQWPRALIDSALASGGRVTVATGPAPRGLTVSQGVTVLNEASDQAAAIRIIQASQVVIGMPGGIDTAGALYAAWASAGGAQSNRPVGLLNHNRAFEVVKGFAGDVASVGRGNIDGLIQVAETFDDLWNRLSRLV
ncbi:hypothetical protein NO932_05030 [Pelagibacterium sp. 26DY04]|uniref:hypothetical protein n=1 Tax=Pelagibacterium sp. 26DY04 TaxID=2967130 RepID=UPI002815EBDD|nr:hypothetical protein [Pelagibacterium sp. 26DY04]WMT87973.1 hypothetical protein NO932_05030 [Pelagibacterium sp. 26DY04]